MTMHTLLSARGRSLFALPLFLTIVSPAVAEVFWVCPPDASEPLEWNAEGCECEAICCKYTSIQAAINAAVNGDEICIAAGVYKESITTGNKLITIRGAVDAAGSPATILDGEGEVMRRLIFCGADGAGDEHGDGVRFENLVIRNGFIVNNDTDGGGGGMYIFQSSPTVENCVFEGNRVEGFAGYGGAVASFGLLTKPKFIDCVFKDNDAEQYGGGMYSQSSEFGECTEYINPSLTNCRFEGNSASQGGGSWTGQAVIHYEACTFDGNTASGAGSNHGGGTYTNKGTVVTYLDCHFELNYAEDDGGGAYHNAPESASSCSTLEATLHGCVFTKNHAEGVGGGMCNNQATDLTISQCQFNENSASEGGGLYNNSSDSTIENCSFIGNESVDGFGGGAYCNAATDLKDTSFRSNEVKLEKQINDYMVGGGALYLAGGGEIEGCSFTYNEVTTSESSNTTAVGGGIFLCNGTYTIKCCTVTGNVANGDGSQGGGIYCSGDDSGEQCRAEGEIDSCYVLSNSAAGSGGIYFGTCQVGCQWCDPCYRFTLKDSTVCSNTDGQVTGGRYVPEGDNCINDDCMNCSKVCASDVTADCVVDGADLAALLGEWDESSGPGDLDGNGLVDGGDLSMLLGDWGCECADPCDDSEGQ